MVHRHSQGILTPVNGTPASLQALHWACQIARLNRAELHALYVLEIPMEYAVETHRDPTAMRQGEEILQQAERIARDANYRLHAGMVSARNAGPAVVQEAIDNSYDLVVLGLPYRRGQSPLPVGGTADFILKNAACQVLVSRESPPDHQPGQG